MVPLHGHQLVIRHGDDSALTDEHGDGCHGDGDLDGLAALVAVHLVAPVVPLAACGQVDLAGLGTLFDDVGHQDVTAEQELDALLVDVGVVLEIVDQSAHDGSTRLACVVLRAVQIRSEAITQQDRVTNEICRAAEHPGLGHGVIVGSGVDGEAGLEDALLHPADEQLLGGSGACKAADICALIGLAGKAHAGDDGDIVLQGLPAGVVITAPGLRVALDAGTAAAADHIGTSLGIVFHNRVCTHLAHQGAHNGLQLSDGAALAVKVADVVLIHQTVILAVVVPDGIGAHGNDGLGQVLLPGGTALGFGEVPESAVAAPPFADAVVLGVLAVFHKDIVGVKFIKAGVAQQDARLDVGHVLGVLFVHGMEVSTGVLEALGVPGKDTALVVLAGVAAGQVESINGEALFLDGVNESQHSVVAVFLQLGVVHAGALIAQSTLGQQSRTAGEQGVVVHNAGDGVAADQEAVQIAAVGLEVGVAGPVVALLAAHVEHGLVEVVVEHADSLFGVTVQTDVEGDVLVESIHLLGIVAHRVGSTLTLERLVLVQLAGLLAKAVEAVVLFHPAVSHNAVVGVLDEGVAGQGAVQLRAVSGQQLEIDGVLLDHQSHLAGGKSDGLVVLGDLSRKRLHAGALALEQVVHTVFPGGGHQDVGFLGQLVVKAGADTDDLVGHEADLDIRVVGVQQESAVLALHAGKTGADFHNAVPHLFLWGVVSDTKSPHSPSDA